MNPEPIHLNYIIAKHSASTQIVAAEHGDLKQTESADWPNAAKPPIKIYGIVKGLEDNKANVGEALGRLTGAYEWTNRKREEN